MVTHGGIDGYSRLVVYLKASNNNRSTTVYECFLSAVNKYNLPSRVRSDQGVENILVAQHMLETRGAERHSMITGCSVHNQRIERLWRDMHRSTTILFYKLFYFMEQHGILNAIDEYHIWALHYVFLPRINNSLVEFKNSWNNHPIRTAQHKSPQQLFTAGALLLQNSGMAALDFFQTVDTSYGTDHDGPLPSTEESVTSVPVPRSTLRFSEADVQMLKQVVDPCSVSENFGIDLYQQTLQFISTLNQI